MTWVLATLLLALAAPFVLWPLRLSGAPERSSPHPDPRPQAGEGEK